MTCAGLGSALVFGDDALEAYAGLRGGLGAVAAMSSRDKGAIRLGLLAASRAGLGRNAALLAVAQGWAESRLGVRKPFLLPDGSPSWNWGATTARAGVPYFGGGDRDYNGNPITQRWAKWPSIDHGLAYWRTFKSVQRALPAMERGDEREMARILFVNGYYTGVSGTPDDRINAYAAWLRTHRKEVLAAEEGSFLEHGIVLGVVGIGAVLATGGGRRWAGELAGRYLP